MHCNDNKKLQQLFKVLLLEEQNTINSGCTMMVCIIMQTKTFFLFYLMHRTSTHQCMNCWYQLQHKLIWWNRKGICSWQYSICSHCTIKSTVCISSEICYCTSCTILNFSKNTSTHIGIFCISAAADYKDGKS